MNYKKDLLRIESVIGQVNLAHALGVTTRSLRHYKQGNRKPNKEVQESFKKIIENLRYKHVSKNKIEKSKKVNLINEAEVKIAKTKKYKKRKTIHIIFKNIDIHKLEIYKKRLIKKGCDSCYVTFKAKIICLQSNAEQIETKSTEITIIEDFNLNILARQLSELKHREDTDKIISIQSYTLHGVKEF